MSIVFAPQTRRTFIKYALCATATASIGPGCGSDRPPSLKEITRYLAGLLRHPEAAGQLGRKYIEIDSAVKSLSLEQLTKMVLQDIGLDNMKEPDTRLEEIGKMLTNKVRQDFADETVVIVDGWLLSKTEARLCALLHLYRNSNS